MKKYAVVISIALVVTAGLWFLKRRPPAASVQAAAQPVPAVSLPTVRAGAPKAPPVAAVSPPSVDKKPLEEVVRRAKSVLPSRRERAEVEAGLKSPLLIAEAKSRLLDTSPRASAAGAQTERMRAIDFLDAALMWKGNPSREQALKTVMEIVNRPVKELEVPAALKESLVGDVVELYGLLLQVDADRAHDAERHAGIEQQRAFQFAQNIVDHRNALRKGE